METVFTPYAALFGGSLIGLASVLLMATLGRIMGATGILGGFMSPTSWSDWSWRAVLLVGMVTAPALYLLATGSWPAVAAPVSRSALILGGLIVGVGVTYGGGCTSGHGVCGMARLSKRSITATLLFMAGAALSVYVTRHLLGM